MSSIEKDDFAINKQIDNKPLRERVADILRTSILRAELKPGDPIVETALAAELGVSRAPLREALQILSKEGLIEIIPYHKTTVRTLHRRDIEELYSLRSVLESFAARQIIQLGFESSVARLTEIQAAMVHAADNSMLDEVSKLDHAFHNTIINESQHNLLTSTWSSISQRVHQVLALRDMHRTDIGQMVRSHQPIIDAIATNDETLAERLIHEHIATASEFIVEVWDQKNDETNT